MPLASGRQFCPPGCLCSGVMTRDQTVIAHHAGRACPAGRYPPEGEQDEPDPELLSPAGTPLARSLGASAASDSGDGGLVAASSSLGARQLSLSRVRASSHSALGIGHLPACRHVWMGRSRGCWSCLPHQWPCRWRRALSHPACAPMCSARARGGEAAPCPTYQWCTAAASAKQLK